MSMIKVITPGAQDFSEPVASLIKVSSRGLRGVDLSDFEKRAGAQFGHELAKLAADLCDDQPLMHLLAIGTTEDYGANRNGDGFRREICRKYHPTFTKHAHYFRNHKNKDAKNSYGQVKLSAFHDPMKRVELAIALNGSEKAAERNNGLYADKEMEKLAKDEDVPVSMACRVSHDVCSYCHNKAPNRDAYCEAPDDGGTCKAGGLKRHMGSLVEIDDGIHQLHADNPDPDFFDISGVFRPADRIAYSMGLLKAAGAGVVGGAELAEAMGVTIPYELLVDSSQPGNVQKMFKLAYQLADEEATIRDMRDMVGAFHPAVQETDLSPPQHCREKIAQALRALTDAKVVLPVEKFVELMAEQSAEKAASVADIVRRELPGIYSRLLATGDLPEKVASCPFVPGPVASPEFRLWAEKQARALSLDRAHVYRRVTQAAMRVDPQDLGMAEEDREKSASDSDAATKMAEAYALYKLAFLGSISESDEEMQLTRSLVLLQNYAL